MYKIYGLKLKTDDIIKYVGATKQPLQYRLTSHINSVKYLKQKRKVNWIIQNINNIEIVELHSNIQTIHEADELEVFYIDKYSENNLLNYLRGGYSSQNREHKGSIPWNKGIPCSYKEKCRLSNNTKIKVYCYDLSGNFLREFDSIKEASQTLNIARASISNSLKAKDGLGKAKEWMFRTYKSKSIPEHDFKSENAKPKGLKGRTVFTVLDIESNKEYSLYEYSKLKGIKEATLRLHERKGYNGNLYKIFRKGVK